MVLEYVIYLTNTLAPLSGKCIELRALCQDGEAETKHYF